MFLVNGTQALYVNTGCLKCISGMNLSPAIRSMLFILYISNKIGQTKVILLYSEAT